MSSEEHPDALGQAQLRAGDLRRVAGLTYRQLTEWDRRGALPSQRRGDTGWRASNAWQAMALRIMAELHRRFGVPLTKLHLLRDWLLGEAPTLVQYIRRSAAKDALYGFSTEETHRSEERVHRGAEHARDLGNGVTLIPLAGSPATSTTDVPSQPSLEELITGYVSLLVPRLVSRGWSEDAATDFSRRFLALATGQDFGTRAFAPIPELLGAASRANDMHGVRAVAMLGSALLPLSEAIALMQCGFLVMLVTDLESGELLAEPRLADWVRNGRLSMTAVVLPVNEHVNEVLTAIGKAPLPVTIRAATPEPAAREEGEAQILELLRKRDFLRLIIEPKHGDYLIKVERDVQIKDEQDIVQLVKAHAYASVTIVRHNGDTVRVTESVLSKIHQGSTDTTRPRG